jgi:dipeptidase
MDKKWAILVVVSLILVCGSPVLSNESTHTIFEEDCTTIIVGKDATADGSVLVAHNEDDSGEVTVRLHVVPENTHPNSFKLTDGSVIYREPHTMLSVSVPETSYGYVWSEMKGLDFSDSYVNEHGVMIASDNAGGSREDNPPLVGGGIRYYLRRLAIEQTRTSRECASYIIRLVEAFGYGHGGRVYITADPSEAWVVQVVNGKHCLAQRVPDDSVVVIPNKYVSREVDLSDTENFMASSGLEEYAIERGWYDPANGNLDFTMVYGNPKSTKSGRNVYRQQTGLYLLTGRVFPADDLPFSVKPDHKITVKELMEVMRSVVCYGYQVDEAVEMPGRFHNNLPMRAISSGVTQESFVMQLRDWLPPEIGVVYWRAGNVPDINAYVAWYPLAMIRSGIDFPETYAYADLDHMDLSSAFWAFRAFTTDVDSNYRARIESVKEMWADFEAREFEMQPLMEEYALNLHIEGKSASSFLSYYSIGLGMDAYTKAIQQLRVWQSA